MVGGEVEAPSLEGEVGSGHVGTVSRDRSGPCIPLASGVRRAYENTPAGNRSFRARLGREHARDATSIVGSVASATRLRKTIKENQRWRCRRPRSFPSPG